MVQPPSQSLLDRPFHMAVVGSYLGRARYGAALMNIPSIHVVGIVDSDLRSARGWARELPGKPVVYSTMERLFEAQPDLDGVVAACAIGERANIIEIAVSDGCSVLTEFPYAKTLAEMDRLIDLAEDRNAWIIPAISQQYEPAVQALEKAMTSTATGLVTGTINRVRCEASFPLGAAYALENGVVPVSIDWYDLLQVVACRTVYLCCRWLGKPVSINADIDLPHHAAIAGRRASDPVANLIVMHERGQATHLLRLSRSVQASERYLLEGPWGSIEATMSSGEKAATGPAVKLHLLGLAAKTIYTSSTVPEDAVVLSQAATNMLTEFTRCARPGAMMRGSRWYAQDADFASNSDIQLGHSAQYRARPAFETVQAAFVSARDGIRIPLPLQEVVDIDAILGST